ncbi:small ribosomal subunit protein eS12-like [Saccopteryx bilineata]|uniref:small ribosomal subunit protein eS12-like n=1 Tax=Saccopteryx bilineata TaxID=59482 RepID=UPI00338E058A
MVKEGIAVGGVMDVNSALQEVLKNTFIQHGPTLGLPKAAKALDECQVHLCVLASTCDKPVYVKLVEALYAEHQIYLTNIDDKKLEEGVGLCKTDGSYQVVDCSCAMVEDYGKGKESQAKDVIKKYFKYKK